MGKIVNFLKGYLFIRCKNGKQIEKYAVAREEEKMYLFDFYMNIQEMVESIWFKLIINKPSQIHMLFAKNDGNDLKFQNVFQYDDNMYLSREVIYNITDINNIKNGNIEIKLWVNQDISFNIYKQYFKTSFSKGDFDATSSYKSDEVVDDIIYSLEEKYFNLEKCFEKKNRDNQKIKVLNQELQSELQEAQSELQEVQSQLQEVQSQLQEVQSELQHKIGALNDMQTQIICKDAHIELLLKVEREFENVKNSKFGRVMYGWWGAKEKLLPQGSKRRLVAKMGKKFIKHPVYMLKKCTPSRIARTVHYMRTESPESVANRLDAATINAGEEIIERIKLDLFPVNKHMFDISDVEKLQLPKFTKPMVSIVLPVYNQFHYTYNCIRSIIKNTENVLYEVVLADDCSTDLTKDIEKIVDNIVVVKTPKNMRFLKNCNNAAKYVKGEYICFLNNDTQVQENWLDSLIDLMNKDDKIGMVGSKLLYPDGTLQEAGGILWKDGSAWNYGNQQSPLAPEFNYVKEADYISGAAIMIRKSLWEEIGGFDDRFAPAYYEDSDLAFEVRKHGYKVMYQPLSQVVHFEGVSNGTDTSSGQKEYQIKNQKKFYEKWKDVLKIGHFPNGENIFWAKDRSRNKKTILVIDHYVPQYDKDAGSRTIWQYIKMFIEKGYNVKFMGDNFYQHEPYTTALQQIGVEVLYGAWYAQNYKQWIIDNKEYIDFAFLNRPHITEKYIDFLKTETNIKCIYYGCDLHCLRIQREYELYHDKKLLTEVEEWKKREFAIMKKTDMNYYPSFVEIEEIRKVDASIPAKTFDIYVYEKFRENIPMDFSKRKGIMFVGGFGHPPNEDAVIWFAEQVYPMIKEKCDMPFYVVGSKPSEKVKKLNGNGIVIKGFVSDDELEELYNTCRMVVIPLRYGAGVKGKVIEALYFGIPMITTSIGIEGIKGAEEFVEIADTAELFADKVVSLYNDNVRLEKTVSDYQDYVKAHCSVEAVWQHVKEDFTR